MANKNSKSKTTKLLLTEAQSMISRLTRFEGFLKSFDTNSVSDDNLKQLEIRSERLKPLSDDYGDIIVQLISESATDESLLDFDEFDDKYVDLISTASLIIDKNKRLSSTASSNSNSSHSCGSQINPKTSSHVKLPQLKLPQFSGNYTDWTSYLDSFTALVHNNPDLSNIEKFMYLNSSLDQSAKRLICNIQPSNDNYVLAFNLLKERYDNPKLIIQGHVKGIFELKPLSRESSLELRNLHDEFSKHVRALSNLNVPVDQCNTFISHILASKFDLETRAEYSKLNHHKIPSLEEIDNFLKKRCQFIEELKSVNKNLNQSNKFKSYEIKEKPSGSKHTFLATNRDVSCRVCKENHSISQCPQFISSPVRQRYETISKLNTCRNCLNHSNNLKCNSRFTCSHCHKRHHTLLHFDNNSRVENQTSDQQISSESNAPAEASVTPVATLTCIQKSNQILLSTACIKIKNSKGKWCNARALLDTGSMNSFITQDFCKHLGLKLQNSESIILGINGAQSNVNNFVNVELASMQNNYKAKISCLVIPKITNSLPLTSFDSSCLEIPKDLILADQNFNKSSPIDVLLGACLFYELLCVGRIFLGRTKPILQKTLLGWLVTGNLNLNTSSSNLSVSNLCVKSNESLDESLIKFWELENVKPKNDLSLLSKTERFCENHFNKTAFRDSSGRFVVSIPFNANLSKLGESKSIALKRFLNLERNLVKNPTLQKQYSDFINEYINLGHMSLVSSTTNNQASDNRSIKTMNTEIELKNLPNYYLPHHAVIKSNSLTTKLRVVFDGSSKSHSGISINQTQLVGPVVQSDLFSILLKFRQYSVALTGDIEKAYRQILITPNERQFQCILWRENPNNSIETYQLNTVTYGTASASYLTTKCLQRLADLNFKKYPKASHIIKSNFYVDDLILSVNSVDEMLQLKNELTNILATAGFPLRKFLSNHSQILNQEESLNSFHTIPLGEREHCKTLGIIWNSNSDSIQFDIKIDLNLKVVSKRTILSTISKIFDPLGLAAPVTIIGKILIQKLWENRLTWDESLPQNLHAEWHQFESQLPLLTSLKIPRCLIPFDSVSIQLHGFSDSSSMAYGSCIYIRSENSLNRIQTQLLCAKSRVAPLHGATIPRLELSAALLLAELKKRVKDSLSLESCQTFLWTDSTIVLNWINAAPNKYKVFVANRIASIQEISNQSDWYHVKSEDNPADLVSRGISPQQIIDKKLWWHGPNFLSNPQFDWPKQIIKTNSNEATEMKSNCFLSVCPHLEACLHVTDKTKQDELNVFERYSSLTKLQRTTAWIFRFVGNSKTSKSLRATGSLTVEELQFSLTLLIKLCQLQAFPDEMKLLANGVHLKGKSCILSLNPFLDENGIIRVGGRLKNSNYPFHKKHPVLLPKKHKLTNLIFLNFHSKFLHCGAQQLLACVREYYWPISGKNSAKKIVKSCVKCFRANPTSYNPLMGNLPLKRLQFEAPAFHNTGLDYAGPILIRDRYTRVSKYLKSYICLFICLTTRAVHLELLTSLTTEAFLSVLKRFISRRGVPSTISCDNAKTFKGAHNYLKELNQFINENSNSLSDYLSKFNIKWEFIIPRNPHEGGIWESNIKSMKIHLKRVLGNTCLNYEEFSTILTQIESVLNSRPLSALSSDPNDFNPLTPGHFLIGRPLAAIPERNLANIANNRLSKFQRSQTIVQHFWKRWSSEVVPDLQKRSKWYANLPNLINVGSLVLLKEDNMPPLNWHLGRVVSVHVGADNIIRSASVRLKNNVVLKRPINKLCSLPIS